MQTVSGLALVLLGRPPLAGDVVVWKGVQIEVLAIAGRGVQDAALTTPPRSPA